MTGPNDDEKLINEKLKGFADDNLFKKLVTGDYQQWEDNSGGQYGPSEEDGEAENETKGKFFYYGFFFQDENNANLCQSLKDADNFVVFVGGNDLQKYTQTGNFTKRGETDKCGENSYSNTGSFLVGNKTALEKSQLQEVQKINIFQVI